MGYNTNCIDTPWADVIGESMEYQFDDTLDDEYEWWFVEDSEPSEPYDWLDWYLDNKPEDEPEQPEDEPEQPEDEADEIVLTRAQSVNLCWHRRGLYCSKREKNFFRRIDNAKPKRKDHRS